MTRSIEVRRHSYTKKGEQRGHGSHLSTEGVRLARGIGEAIGPFARVLVSDVPRTLETAIAMGFAVDEVLPFPQVVQWEAVIEEMGWHALWEIDQPFAHVAEVLPSQPQAAAMGEHYARKWLETAMTLPNGGSALAISHGQIMEAALVVCLPGADFGSWGRPFSHCEGARLLVEDGAFVNVELLRVPESTKAGQGAG